MKAEAKASRYVGRWQKVISRMGSDPVLVQSEYHRDALKIALRRAGYKSRSKKVNCLGWEVQKVAP